MGSIGYAGKTDLGINSQHVIDGKVQAEEEVAWRWRALLPAACASFELFI